MFTNGRGVITKHFPFATAVDLPRHKFGITYGVSWIKQGGKSNGNFVN